MSKTTRDRLLDVLKKERRRESGIGTDPISAMVEEMEASAAKVVYQVGRAYAMSQAGELPEADKAPEPKFSRSGAMVWPLFGDKVLVLTLTKGFRWISLKEKVKEQRLNAAGMLEAYEKWVDMNYLGGVEFPIKVRRWDEDIKVPFLVANLRSAAHRKAMEDSWEWFKAHKEWEDKEEEAEVCATYVSVDMNDFGFVTHWGDDGEPQTMEEDEPVNEWEEVDVEWSFKLAMFVFNQMDPDGVGRATRPMRFKGKGCCHRNVWESLIWLRNFLLFGAHNSKIDSETKEDLWDFYRRSRDYLRGKKEIREEIRELDALKLEQLLDE